MFDRSPKRLRGQPFSLMHKDGQAQAHTQVSDYNTQTTCSGSQPLTQRSLSCTEAKFLRGSCKVVLCARVG